MASPSPSRLRPAVSMPSGSPASGGAAQRSLSSCSCKVAARPLPRHRTLGATLTGATSLLPESGSASCCVAWQSSPAPSPWGSASAILASDQDLLDGGRRRDRRPGGRSPVSRRSGRSDRAPSPPRRPAPTCSKARGERQYGRLRSGTPSTTAPCSSRRRPIGKPARDRMAERYQHLVDNVGAALDWCFLAGRRSGDRRRARGCRRPWFALSLTSECAERIDRALARPARKAATRTSICACYAARAWSLMQTKGSRRRNRGRLDSRARHLWSGRETSITGPGPVGPVGRPLKQRRAPFRPDAGKRFSEPCRTTRERHGSFRRRSDDRPYPAFDGRPNSGPGSISSACSAGTRCRSSARAHYSLSSRPACYCAMLRAHLVAAGIPGSGHSVGEGHRRWRAGRQRRAVRCVRCWSRPHARWPFSSATWRRPALCDPAARALGAPGPRLSGRLYGRCFQACCRSASGDLIGGLASCSAPRWNASGTFSSQTPATAFFFSARLADALGRVGRAKEGLAAI